MASSTTFRIAQAFNRTYVRNGTKSYVAAMNKFKFQPTKPGPYSFAQTSGKEPGVLSKTDASGNVGTVTAEDIQNDSEYLCPVEIGTPAQTFQLDFDTGSSDLWIFSTELPASTQKSAASANHAIFDPSKSSTFKKESSTWKISYGDGSSASGTTGTDVVNVGGISIQNQVIELAKTLSSEFASGAGDGLLGLAWPAINTVTPTQAATPVENMISQGLIAQPLFTAHLASYRQATDSTGGTAGSGSDTAASGRTSAPTYTSTTGATTTDTSANDLEGQSFYTFGGVDTDLLSSLSTSESAIQYTAVDNSQGFWQFTSASAEVAGKTVSRSGNTAIADTGTTLALVDDSTVEAIYAAIPGAKYDSTQQGYIFPSSVTADQLPVVSFAVGDAQFTIPKESLSFADAGNGMVYGGVQSRGSMTFDILGDTFLKGIYAVFDQGNQRFGAVQRPDPTTTL